MAETAITRLESDMSVPKIALRTKVIITSGDPEQNPKPWVKSIQSHTLSPTPGHDP